MWAILIFNIFAHFIWQTKIIQGRSKSAVTEVMTYGYNKYKILWHQFAFSMQLEGELRKSQLDQKVTPIISDPLHSQNEDSWKNLLDSMIKYM